MDAAEMRRWRGGENGGGRKLSERGEEHDDVEASI